MNHSYPFFYLWTVYIREVQSLIPYKEKYSLTQAEKKAKEYLVNKVL
jgi:hypothetical protein